jgi:predicted transcriptional regulator
MAEIHDRNVSAAASAAPVLESTLDGASTAALGRTLGQREREVMSIVCGQGSASVQQVSERLSVTLAYTTVMTTLDRLFKKGFLRRQKHDRAFIYSAKLTSREIEDHRAAGLVRRFFTDSEENPDILVSCLVDAVHDYDTRLLDQLEARIRAARARQPESSAGSGEES